MKSLCVGALYVPRSGWCRAEQNRTFAAATSADTAGSAVLNPETSREKSVSFRVPCLTGPRGGATPRYAQRAPRERRRRAEEAGVRKGLGGSFRAVRGPVAVGVASPSLGRVAERSRFRPGSPSVSRVVRPLSSACGGSPGFASQSRPRISTLEPIESNPKCGQASFAA